MTKKVYLAGGFRSGWQNIVKQNVKNSLFLDPSLHDIKDPTTYTAWDINAVIECDILFAFMEISNPAGYAMSLEIGYAKALGKTIIFTEEPLPAPRKRHFDMVREVCDYNCNTLVEGMDVLQKIVVAS
jgi:nucleoside 2-deoxyribosyltransferase